MAGFVLDFRPMIICRISATVAGSGGKFEVRALIDTGATDCHIREDLRQKIGAPIDGQVHATAIGSEGLKPICRINLEIPAFDKRGTLPTIWPVTGARTIIDTFDPHSDMIIGMNVLILRTLVVARGVPTILLD